MTSLAIFYLGIFCGVMGLAAAEIIFGFNVRDLLDDPRD
jgi:hypothetical protein